MTPNDKLPEEIREQIESEATGYIKGLSIEHSKAHKKDGYIAGATAWAGWKVRFDELKARCDKMAQLLYMLQSVHSHEWSEGNKENVKQTLQQWQQFKDGKSKGEPAKELWVQANATWNSYPNGTKAKALMGGYWIKTDHGWHWPGGSTFPTPGGDATGEICLPIN